MHSANCIGLNSPGALGSAADIDRSPPRTLCHCFAEVLICEGKIESSISLRRMMRCSGRARVFLIVSINQPSTNFKEAQEQSP